MRASGTFPGSAGRPIRRTVSALLGAVVLVLVLPGCFQLRQDLRVDPDGTVSGSLRLGVDRRLVDAGQGGDVELVRSSLGSVPDVAGVTVSTYAEDGYAGQQIELDRVAVAAFGAGDTGDLAFELTPDGLRLRMRSPAGRVEAVAAPDVPVAAPVARPGEASPDLAADVHLAVTFPGRVQWHNGTEVQGSTVIWRYRSLAEVEAAPAVLEAVWDDSGLVAGSVGGAGSGRSAGRLADPAVVVLAAGVLAAWVLVRRRRAWRPGTIWLTARPAGAPVSPRPLGRPGPMLALGPGPSPASSSEGPAGSTPADARPARPWPPPPMHRQPPPQSSTG